MTMRSLSGVLFVALMSAGAAQGQCERWLAGPLYTPRGEFLCSTTWDPDGAGPQMSRLVFGGNFRRVGARGRDGVLADNIATLTVGADGSRTWAALGGGLREADPLPYNGMPPYGGRTGVFSVGVYGGEVVATGWFEGPSRNLARWDGVAWRPIADLDGPGFALHVHEGKLYVGGAFEKIGEFDAAGLAAWDGQRWHAVGGGVSGFEYRVKAITTYDGRLIVGGRFDDAGGVRCNSVAAWDGARWSPLGTGLSSRIWSGEVLSLAEYRGDLYMGGTFSEAGSVWTQQIARWDGERWSEVGDGGVGSLEWSYGVHGLAVYEGELILAGAFNRNLARQDFQNIARWDGERLDRVNEDGGEVFETVRTLQTFGGKLYAAGLSIQDLSVWDGSDWEHVRGSNLDDTPSPGIRAIVPYEKSFAIGGEFVQPTGTFSSVRNLAACDRYTLRGLTDGLRGPVLALLNRESPAPWIRQDLYIGTPFDATTPSGKSLGGILVHCTEYWGETSIVRAGGGLNGTVRAFAMFKGDVIAGGDFNSGVTGGGDLRCIARFDGSVWHPLDPRAAPNGPVHALASAVLGQRTSLAVGGAFTRIGNVPASRIARYDIDSATGERSWTPLGEGLNGRVSAVAWHDGELYAAGDFTASGTSTMLRIARFRDGVWTQVGSGFDAEAMALCSHDGVLYAGGRFTASGAEPISRVARWDGRAWAQVQGGVSNDVHALSVIGGELVVGGDFSRVGESGDESPYLARFSLDGVPQILGHPEFWYNTCHGDNIWLAVNVAEGYRDATFIWRKDGVPLVDGPTPHGSIVEIQGDFLEISSIHPLDRGVYDCVVSNACGAAISLPAELNFCIANFNCDWLVDAEDYALFVQVFEQGAEDRNADLNGDGVVDFFDYDLFIGAFEDGC